MRLLACHLVPLALLLGCHSTAVIGNPPGDLGAPVDGGRPSLDLGGPGDLGTPDFGAACPFRQPDFACHNEEGGAMQPIAGQPFELPVFVGRTGECFCGETVACEVRVRPDGAVELTTGFCQEGPLCDACFPTIEGRCAVPALDAGEHDVFIDGQLAMALQVLPAGVRPPFSPRCIAPQRIPDRTACNDFELSAPGPPGFDSLCHPVESFVGARVDLTVATSCDSCIDAPGPCEVIVTGDTLTVVPRRREGTCEVDCPAICFSNESRCVTPPLPEGDYRVIVEGSGVTSALRVTSVPSFPVETVCILP
ncbi:MAG: hypothetical protein AAGH15_15615 [Myxococcota bacterium]